jgi:ATP-dependent Lon protease
MKLHFVAEMDDVLKLALEGALPKLEDEKPEALNPKMPPPSTLRPPTEARQ